jgi:hypothetical protein
MSTRDKNGWSEGMEDAPRDQRILVLIPDDANEDFDHEIACWDEETGRWEGEWRNLINEDATPHALTQVEPTHWKLLDLPEVFSAAEAAA